MICRICSFYISDMMSHIINPHGYKASPIGIRFAPIRGMETIIMIVVGIAAVAAGIRGYYSDSASDPTPPDRDPVQPWQPPTDNRKPNRPETVAKLPTIRAPNAVRSGAPAVATATIGPVVPPLLPVAPDKVEEIGSPWFDDRACWGCSKRCTYRGFSVPGGSTADEIKRRAELKYRAEHGGYASDLDAMDGDTNPGAREGFAPSEWEFDPIAVARAVGEAKRRNWYAMTDECGRAYRRDLYGLASTVAAGVDRILEDDEEHAGVEDGIDVSLEGCPF